MSFLWIKVGLVAFILSIGAWFTHEFKERDARIEAEAAQKAIHATRAAQVEQALKEKQEEVEEFAERAEKAIKALTEREQASQHAIEQVNHLMAEIRDLRQENEELKAWSDRYHPSAVNGVYRAAVTGDSIRSHSGDETDLPPPSSQSGSNLPDR